MPHLKIHSTFYLTILTVFLCAFTLPTSIKAEEVLQLELGGTHTCTLMDSGFVRCWGENIYNQAGGDSRQRFILLPNEVKGLENIVEISAADNFSCALTKEEKIKCWGWHYPTPLEGFHNGFTPLEMKGVQNIIRLGKGSGGLPEHFCGVTREGFVQCWGENEYGQSDTQQIGKTHKITGVTFGTSHTCVLIDSGRVKCWGIGEEGVLGDGTTRNQTTPVFVKNLSGVKKLASGGFQNCALLKDKIVKCWGRVFTGIATPEGQEQIIKLMPALVKNLSGVKDLDVSWGHACAVVENGRVKCWGDNSYGQLGDGTTQNKKHATFVKNLTGAKQVKVGGYQSCALIKDGSLKCWGYNLYGQLGDGSRKSSSIPVQVKNLYSVDAEPTKK